MRDVPATRNEAREGFRQSSTLQPVMIFYPLTQLRFDLLRLTSGRNNNLLKQLCHHGGATSESSPFLQYFPTNTDRSQLPRDSHGDVDARKMDRPNCLHRGESLSRR